LEGIAMATVELTEQQQDTDGAPAGVGDFLNGLLAPLASLKLTVTLFALAIFLILASTLAQVEKDIWQVIDDYYRAWFAWIDWRLFVPPSFWKSLFNRPVPTIPGGFYFPGGALIGSLMALNLLAAHLVRFRVQARGWRLVSGLLVTGAGILLTTLIILGGHNPHGLQGEAWISYQTLWWLFLAGLTGSCFASAYGWWRLAPEQRLSRWLVGAAVLLQGVLVGYLYSRGSDGRLSDSAMRILWQLTQGGAAAAVLLAGCLLLFKKRAGIVLLHGGVGLMMFGGFLVDRTAVEGQLQMQEGETVNFVQDIRTVELAIVDRSDPESDRVTVIPKPHLVRAAESKQPIRHDLLPFEIRVDRFLQNADLRKVKAEDDNPANQGLGRDWLAEPVRPGAGADSSSKVDLSAAYITILPKGAGEPLGTWLVSLLFSAQNIPQTVAIDGKSYELWLRFKRTYKPYRFQLLDVRKDDYLGTDTPRNYSSDVRLVDPTRNVDRELRIWMNNPLRFAGETFYQSSYHRDPQTQQEGTTLAVVTNTGWMIPYISCMLVMIGMLAHFSITLTRFLVRVETERRAAAGELAQLASLPASGRHAPAPSSKTKPQPQTTVPAVGRGPRALLAWSVPAAAAVVCGAWVLSTAREPRATESEFDLAAFGRLPVIADGRAKPLDTLARSTMLVLSSRQYYEDHNEQPQPAIRWLLELMIRPDVAFQQRVVRIDNLDVQTLLGLERRERFRYAPAEFLPQLEKLTEQAEQAHNKDPADITVYDKKILELEKKIGILDLLLQAFTPPRIESREDLMTAINRQQALKRRHPPLAAPPTDQRAEWDTFASAWTMNYVKSKFLDQPSEKPTEAIARILVAFADNDPKAFNKAVAEYRQWLGEHGPGDVSLAAVDFEAFYNHFQPFGVARGLYIAAFALGMLAWLLSQFTTAQTFTRTAVAVALVAFAVHTFALIARMYISGRPPVTNLYSSAVFIGWGAAGFGLLLNLFFRQGVGTILATVAAFITLGIANHLAADGDTFTVLQAVLDTQFWLATHVTCITFGYMTTYAAGLLGLLYVCLGLCTPWLTRDLSRDLTRMTYGTLCFSIFFSFVGTVLGGLWADDSWGRFWGWDPKENGALMIVLWNALVLHARWGKMIQERGLALLSIAGNIFVSWSWFGVNELGVGLHAYGFREGMVFWLSVAALAHLAIIAAGMIPQRYWLCRVLQPPSTAA
jgi:ABC-type transport system involved in cytochrome c biogenesis permease subunit